MNREVDFDSIDLTEEDLKTKLRVYEMVRSLSYEHQKLFKHKFTRTPISDILQTDFLRTYQIPLCFRDANDDLSVEPRDDNVLDPPE